jgi:hypothetical protein
LLEALNIETTQFYLFLINTTKIFQIKRFGTILGRKCAFLIQNMCPVMNRYITPYIDKNKQPIKIDDRVVQDIIKIQTKY